MSANVEGGAPLHLLCRWYLRNLDCEGRCTGAHAAKPLRAPCAAWLHARGTRCPFGESCWFPHALPAVLCVVHPARGALQVRASHVERVVAFLHALLPPFVALERAREHGAGKRADVLLLLCAEGAAEFNARAALLQLLDLPFLAPALVRCFVFAGVARSREELALRLRAALPRAGSAAAARLHCFPRTLERELADALRSCEGGSSVALSKADPAVVACVGAVGGVFYYGLEGARGSPVTLLRAGSGSAGPGGAVCRAEHKLREAMLRSPACAAAFGGGGLALDIGSAPGGWVQALAEAPLGFAGVVAVDPGELRWPLAGCEERSIEELGGALPALAAAAGAPERPATHVFHLKEQGAPAIARLLQAGGARLFSSFTCDANVSAPAAMELFSSALPLLKGGAFACLTLKNFTGAERAWEAGCDDAEARFRAVCGNVARLHLFANAVQEVTLVGNVV